MNLKSIIAIGLVMTVFACKKNDANAPIVEPIDDNSLPASAILNLQITDKAADHITFKLNVAIFRDSKNIEDQLSSKNFVIDSFRLYSDTLVFNNNSTQINRQGAAATYSSVMLMDQSGSISDTDPKDYRLDAAKIFCSNLGNGNNASLWYFSGFSYKQLTEFTTDTAALVTEIEKLRGTEGGNTPLYDAQEGALNYVYTNGGGTNKAVLAFTDGQDSGYGTTAGKVTDHAKEKNVKLYNIGLGNVSTGTLLNQAVATQGGFMYAKDARQLISIFGNLGKLLDNTAAFYQTEWTIKTIRGREAFKSGVLISHQLKVNLPYGGEVVIPFQIDTY